MVLSRCVVSESAVLAQVPRLTYECNQEHGDVDRAHNDCHSALGRVLRGRLRGSLTFRLDDVRQLIRLDGLISRVVGIFEGHDGIRTGLSSGEVKFGVVNWQQLVSYLTLRCSVGSASNSGPKQHASAPQCLPSWFSGARCCGVESRARNPCGAGSLAGMSTNHKSRCQNHC